MTTSKNNLRVGLVVPHIFLHRDVLPQVIFSPGYLALDLAHGLQEVGAEVTLFTPGPVDVSMPNVTADLSLFEQELSVRNDTYMELLKKHPFTFVTLARQVQAELIAKAFAMANANKLDIVHIYTNEEDIALPFAALCSRPVVLTHHDPYNFLVKYKSVFPKYKQLPWLSLSYAQRSGMPDDTNWLANIYHGLQPAALQPVKNPTNDYIAYLGRIIEPKGLHLAIAAAKQAGVRLKIAGKHYSGQKDSYWQKTILPQLDDTTEYIGFIKDNASRQAFLANARGLIVPSTFNEPFGMVSIESLACGTPVIGLDIGATKEIIGHGRTGFIVPKADDQGLVSELANAIKQLPSLDRKACRASFEQRFTLERMCHEHLQAYRSATE